MENIIEIITDVSHIIRTDNDTVNNAKEENTVENVNSEVE